MTDGLFATIAITHVGPLVDNPVSANAASVPTACGEVLDEAGAKLLVQRGQAAGELRLRLVICAVSSSNSCHGSRVET